VLLDLGVLGVASFARLSRELDIMHGLAFDLAGVASRERTLRGLVDVLEPLVLLLKLRTVMVLHRAPRGARLRTWCLQLAESLAVARLSREKREHVTCFAKYPVL
jgi:hypothetical protein